MKVFRTQATTSLLMVVMYTGCFGMAEEACPRPRVWHACRCSDRVGLWRGVTLLWSVSCKLTPQAAASYGLIHIHVNQLTVLRLCDGECKPIKPIVNTRVDSEKIVVRHVLNCWAMFRCSIAS